MNKIIPHLKGDANYVFKPEFMWQKKNEEKKKIHNLFWNNNTLNSIYVFFLTPFVPWLVFMLFFFCLLHKYTQQPNICT